MTTARQYAFTEEDVQDPTQLAYLLNRLLSTTLSLKDSLDAIADGATYKKVVGVDGSTHQISTASVLPAAITNTQIADNSISTPKLQANAVTAAKIAADTITANEIAANAITTSELAANAVTAAKIAAHTITANEIAAGTITATEIAATTITAGKLVAHTLTANEIAAGTITATEIAAATITGAKIAATTISASNIVAGTITANEIAATTITAGKLNISTLSAIAADVGTLNAGKIQNAGATAGILLSGALPGGWTTYLDLTASGANPLLHHSSLDLNANGTANFSGTVSASSFTATTATFKNITLDGAGGIQLSMKDGAGSEVVRLSTSASIGGTIAAWTPNHNNPGFALYFGGSNIGSATGLWAMEWDANDIYFNLGGTDIFKINGSGSIQLVLAPPTTASGANCFIDTTNSNQLKRSTSSLRFKTDVRAIDDASTKDLVLALQPIVFKSICPGDPPDRDYIGLGAEDVAALDEKYVFVNEKGVPDGVQYDRLVVPLLSFVQQLHQRVLALETPLTPLAA